MSAGGKRDLIALQRAQVTQDDYNEEVHDWQEIGREWAEIHYGRGDERRQAAMEQGKLPATFVVFDNALTRSLKLKDRITFDEGEWDVVQNTPGKSGEREITATRAVA